MRTLKWLLVALALVALGSAALAWRWLDAPLKAPAGGADVTVSPGMSARGIAQAAVQAGVSAPPQLLFVWFRLSGDAQRMKAGSYLFESGITPRELLGKMVRGEQTLVTLTIPEGWNWRQLRSALQAHPHLRASLKGQSDAELMQALGRAGQHPEGQFFPDTYSFARGSQDIDVLRQAMRAMDAQLAAAWAARAPDVAVSTPRDALILASIIEKETGVEADRPLVAAVFSNRLRIDMRLQTDPTVIYGMGERFDGNLRRADLLADTPWNTYTRKGLPPTPIALPGRASLLAAVAPARTDDLYFVARGDGSSEFSTTLAQHNAAVNKYQRGQ